MQQLRAMAIVRLSHSSAQRLAGLITIRRPSKVIGISTSPRLMTAVEPGGRRTQRQTILYNAMESAVRMRQSAVTYSIFLMLRSTAAAEFSLVTMMVVSAVPASPARGHTD